jgi:hypothetical protein
LFWIAPKFNLKELEMLLLDRFEHVQTQKEKGQELIITT